MMKLRFRMKDFMFGKVWVSFDAKQPCFGFLGFLR